MVLVGLAVVAGAAFIWLSSGEPDWYQPPSANDQAAAALAEAAEYRLVEEAQKIRPPGDEWTLRISDEQINAWLAMRLADWLAMERETDFPDWLGTPQVHTDPRGLSIAAELGKAASGRIAIARAVPQFTDSGLLVRVDSVSIGRIGLPGDPVQKIVDALRDASGEADDGVGSTIADILSGTRAIQPQVSLADGRMIQVEGVLLRDGAIDVTCKTIVSPPRKDSE